MFISTIDSIFIKWGLLCLAIIFIFHKRLSLKFFILIIALLTISFFSEYLAADRLYLYGDIKRVFYPAKQFYADQLKGFKFPLWYPYNGCGFSFIGESQAGIFYPLNILLFSIFPLNLAFNFSIIIHFILSGIFTYAYARQIKMDCTQAALSAVVYTFNGAFITQIIHFNIMTILPWTPLIFYLIELGFSRSASYWFIMSFIIAVQFLAGHPQTVIFANIGTGLYFLIMLIFKYNKFIMRKLLLFTTAVIFAFLLSSIQILPVLELKPYSIRAVGFTNMFFDYSVHPKFFINSVFPFFYGVDNWGTYFGSWNFQELCFYIGPVVLFLCLLGFFKGKESIYVKSIICFCILFLILMMGKYGMLYKLFYYIPLFRGFRCPNRFKYLLLFWISIMASIGLEALYQSLHHSNRKKAIGFSLYSALLLTGIFAILIWQKKIIGLIVSKLFILWPRLIITYFNRKYTLEELNFALSHIDIKAQEFLTAIISRGYIYLYLVAMIVFCGICLLKLNKPQQISKSMFNKAVILVIFFDLMLFKNYYLQAPVRLPDGNKIVEKLLQDNSLFRIYDKHLLIANYNYRYKINNICQYGGLFIARVEALLGNVKIKDSHLSGMGILSLLNVKYIISNNNLDNKDLLLIESDAGLNLYENKSVVNRCFFIENIKEIEKSDIFSFCSNDKGKLNLDKTKILNIDYRPNEIIIKTDNNIDAFLLVSDLYYPGWKAFVDGDEVEIKNIGQLLRAVFVKKGADSIRFVYQPLSVRLGACISIVSFILVSAILVSNRIYGNVSTG